MARRGFWLLLVFLLFSSIAVVADDEPSGSISVEVRKLDNQLSMITVVVLAVVVIVALALSLYLLFTSRHKVHKAVPSISIGAKSPMARHDGYYDEVFNSPLPDAGIVDEKSPHAAFIKEEGYADFERYLKEDERIVINVLKMKGNSCSQATLRVVTDFSKARLSRILAELECRGIVTKVQDGRKNMVTLRS